MCVYEKCMDSIDITNNYTDVINYQRKDVIKVNVALIHFASLKKNQFLYYCGFSSSIDWCFIVDLRKHIINKARISIGMYVISLYTVFRMINLCDNDHALHLWRYFLIFFFLDFHKFSITWKTCPTFCRWWNSGPNEIKKLYFRRTARKTLELDLIWMRVVWKNVAPTGRARERKSYQEDIIISSFWSQLPFHSMPPRWLSYSSNGRWWVKDRSQISLPAR